MGFSPNRLLNGFDVDLLQRVELPERSTASPKGRAANFVEHLQKGADLAQAAIAFRQQRQKENADRSRRPAEQFRVGDKVWLLLRNMKTNRPSKKLDWLYAKYTVTAVPNTLNVVLDVLGRIHKTFHVDLVERVADDPLPSQAQTHTEPGPVTILDDDDMLHDEWEVEEIYSAKNGPGRGNNRRW